MKEVYWSRLNLTELAQTPYLYILTSQCSEVKASSKCSNLKFLFPISTFRVLSKPDGDRKSNCEIEQKQIKVYLS